jgi:peptide/nickel transport system substrate-binding protein
LIAAVLVVLLTSTAASGAEGISATLHVTADNTDVDHSDPGLAYGVLSWQIEYETCMPLVGYSDVSGTKVGNAITPIGAVGMPVITNFGKTYVFTVRSGMKFSDGSPLTAANYKYAFDRDALKNFNSPVSAFMSNVKGWDVEATNAGVGSVRGVTASVNGRRLTIQLTKPDGTLLPILAMPFFCPIEKAPPFYVSGHWVDSEVNTPYPGAGPYYLASRAPTIQVVLKRNPYYAGLRPHVASTIVIDMGTSTNTAYNGIETGVYASDLNGNPEPAQNHALFNQYGKNQSRFWVEPELAISYLAMNEARPTFAPAHVKVRQAVNDVIDRPGIAAIAGYLSGSPQTQTLPKPLAGIHWQANYKYPITAPDAARFAAARTLSNNCAGHAHINFWHGSSAPALQAASLDSYDLSQMGCVVNSVSCSGYGYRCNPWIKGTSMDIITAGWYDDYPDGYDWFGILFNGRTIVATSNNDLAFMNNRTVNAKTDACNRLTGAARVNCWGALDQWMTGNVAPWATELSTNFVDYISANAHGYVFNGSFGSVDLGDLYQS